MSDPTATVGEKPKRMEQLFVIYDERAEDGSTDDASVCDTARSLKEARRVGPTYGRVAIYCYDVVMVGDKRNLINERFIEAFG
jgi:hypothetical protein